jgi:hypothetical protein
MKHRRSVVAISGLVGLALLACGTDEISPRATSTVGGASTADNSAGGSPALAGSGGALATGGSNASQSTGGSVIQGSGGTNAVGGQVVTGTGGANAVGGQTASGGSVNANGGTPSTGGMTTVGGATATATGGLSSTGGASSTGGKATSGGSSSVGGGATATGGAKATGGARATGGTTAAGGVTATGGTKATGGAVATGGASGASALAHFSFFVASQVAMTRLSGSANGFGGDLRYGLTDGLSGADKICTEIAESVMPGAGAKGWRAFLSVTAGPSGTPVNAIDRVGPGPFYDRLGRVVAMTAVALANVRPQGADPAIINDLPNENGTPNHVASGTAVDNHDTLTGSNAQGQIGTTTRASTCNDWTSSVGATGRPQIGHSWPRTATSAMNWIADHTAPGCEAGVNTSTQGGSGSCVGCGGGYGGIYCFALTP